VTEREIFHEALEITDAGERSAYLDKACAGNAALKQHIEGLLEIHSQLGSFLEVPVAGMAAASSLPDQPGAMIGHYKLLQKLGEGGMGVVWVAEQQKPVKRRVALKVIKPGLDSAQVLRRFDTERQALAVMDHTNIAKVLDAGTIADEPGRASAGRPYFVMELVQGVPITRYCDEVHLPVRERLQLLVPVCHAIQHAHQKGIIHRDIKPSNVLVCMQDGRPVPKVIDFGVAKALRQRLGEGSMYTEFGAVIGTLEYMSPEQAEISPLGVDTRTDVYALGVLAYELLTGTTPLQKESLRQAVYTEAVRLIKEQDPPKPSTRLTDSKESLANLAALRRTGPARLTREVRGELDWIVMKALEKDRTRRYEGAGDLARDIERYLHDEPIEACPPSKGYRLKKFARKNKGPVLTALSILFFLVIAVIGTTWGLIRAERARAEAVRARQAEVEQRQLAQANAEAESKAKKTAEAREAETRAVLDFVQNRVFAAARPKGQAGGLGWDITLHHALEAALPFVDKSFADQPLIEAQLRLTLGNSFWYLDKAQIAAEQFQAARAIYTRHGDERNMLGSMRGLANCYKSLGRHLEAQKLREEILVRRRTLLGIDHPDTLSSMMDLANSYRELGRYRDAVKLHEEALGLAKVKLGADDRQTLRLMNNLASTYYEAGRHQEAVKLSEETLTLRRAKFGKDDPDTLRSMMGLANSYYFLGRQPEALRLYEETLALQKVHLGPDNSETLRTMNNLANAYAAIGREPDALKLRLETLRLQKANLGPTHPDTLTSMGNVALSYSHLGQHAGALKLGEETLALRKATSAPDHPATLLCMNNVACTYDDLGRHAEALKLHQETLALRKAKLGENHPDTLRSMEGVATSLMKLGRATEAVLIIDDCLRRTAGQVVASRLPVELIELRLRHFAKIKDATGCRATAEMWETLGRTDANSLYNAACFRAVTTGVIRVTNKSLVGAGQTQAEGDRAMAWLKQALSAGYHDVANMKKDADLDALREREDFKTLIICVEAESRLNKKDHVEK
jgi:eukaryotic-like serine/threonine-protein kinase